MQSRGVRRPSVCLSVCPSVRLSVCKLCANRYFYHRSGWIATKLAHDGPQKSPHPECAQGQGQGQRSRDTDTFVISRESLLLTGKWLDREQTCTQYCPQMGLHPGCAQGQGQGQGRRSRDTDTSVMSRNVYYTVPSGVLSLHALTLRSTVTLSFQYKSDS